jgi:hypothetical protein
MNPTRLPKEVLLPDWVCRDMKGTKDDRVQHIIHIIPISANKHVLLYE